VQTENGKTDIRTKSKRTDERPDRNTDRQTTWRTGNRTDQHNVHQMTDKKDRILQNRPENGQTNRQTDNIRDGERTEE
jgi:hypothetical protein